MNYTYSDELYHFGVKGMKWGVRRYQNEDGTLTEAGRIRYRRMAEKLVGLEEKANRHRAKITARQEAKVARLNKKAEKYKLKRAKTLKAVSRFIAPLKPKVAMRRLAKYELKSEKAELKAKKLIEKMANEKVKADKYEERAKKLIAKIEKEFNDYNVKDSSLLDVTTKNGWGTSAEVIANVGNRLGVSTREDRMIDESNKRWKEAQNKSFAKAEKAKKGSLSVKDKMDLENYITNVNELYGYSSSVSKEEYDRANRLYEKHFGHRTRK